MSGRGSISKDTELFILETYEDTRKDLQRFFFLQDYFMYVPCSGTTEIVMKTTQYSKWSLIKLCVF